VPQLTKFLAAHPQLAAELVPNDRQFNLVEEGIDVALRAGSLSGSSMTVRKMAAGPCYVLGTTACFARAGVLAIPGDLLQHSAAVYKHVSGGESRSFRQGTPPRYP
jgi:DNA-binding transcriptional LysR family regulator